MMLKFFFLHYNATKDENLFQFPKLNLVGSHSCYPILVLESFQHGCEAIVVVAFHSSDTAFARHPEINNNNVRKYLQNAETSRHELLT